MEIYITYSKTKSGVKIAYACVGGGIQNFYYRRFDKDTSEQEAFDYVMSFVYKSNRKFAVISNNKKMAQIIRRQQDTKNISFLGQFDSEKARDIFLKLQVVLIGGK